MRSGGTVRRGGQGAGRGGGKISASAGSWGWLGMVIDQREAIEILLVKCFLGGREAHGGKWNTSTRKLSRYFNSPVF